jgi:hypothetical protein
MMVRTLFQLVLNQLTNQRIIEFVQVEVEYEQKKGNVQKYHVVSTWHCMLLKMVRLMKQGNSKLGEIE